ncbi:hypothetical protein GC101_28740 [Paenibacillus sp. LMG 31459]|jgi:hypothetical protein|uniref:DUF4183 domain-containing protein n=1 Tax=Paenibacillus phytohabitans TaxID=2654978 RepID=A0ABX1YP65_9BACL|nr:hypothetical protein [Paenibacillus phytohabitans]NOU82857.1 hypothetical protein [Paenibacillus phytohabitans]
MPNDAVFNQNSQPLYTEQVNTYIAPGIDTLPEAGAAMSGLLFGFSFASTVTTAAPLVMQVSNPGGSGRTVYISRVIASTGTAAVTLTLLRNATVGGSIVTPVNYNFGSAVTSVTTARTATAAPTGSPATLMSLLLATGPVILDLDGRIILPPGSSLTISITIASGSTAATGNISWWEN